MTWARAEGRRVARRPRLAVAAGLCLVGAAVSLARAQPPTPGPAPGLTLRNGLQVFIAPRPGSRTVSIEIGVRVGSRDEPLELQGISHLLEHLLFKEGHGSGAGRTARNPAFSALRAAGAQINATTEFELTEYHADLPAERFEEGWHALLAMVTQSAFDAEDLRRERGVVLQEIALGKTDPLAIMAYSLLRRIFPGDPLGQPVIGFKKTLERVEVSDVESYHRRFYVPSNMMVAIAGDVEPQAAAKLVAETIGGVEPSVEPGLAGGAAARFAHPPYPPVAAQLEPRYAFRTLVSQAYLFAGALTGGAAADDAPALTLLATILGDGKSSRLYRRLVEDEAFSNEVLALAFDVSNAGAFACGLAVAPAKADSARAILLEELDGLAREPVSAAELATARMQARGRLARALETNAGVADFAIRRMLLRQPVSPDAVLERLDRLDPAALQAAAARTWGSGSQRGVVEIQVLPARGFGKVIAALKFLIWRRL